MALLRNIAGVGAVTSGDEYYDPIKAGDGSGMTQVDIININATVATTAGTVMLAFPPWGTVAGAIVIGVAALMKVAGRLFGNKWRNSTQVRWLLQHYQFDVLGNQDVTSDNKVDETLLQPCYNFFTAVLGVPVYDDDRLQVLSGNDFEGNFLNNSREERAVEYLKFWDAQEEGVTFDRAMAATYSADWLRDHWRGEPGDWKDAPVSPYWVAYRQHIEAGNSAPKTGLNPDGLTVDAGSVPNKNMVLIMAAAVGVGGVYYMFSGKTK